MAEPSAPTVEVREVRVLEGPNLYFPRPAVKVQLAAPALAGIGAAEAKDLARRVGLRSARPGRPHTELRQRWLMRLGAHLVRRLGAEVGVRRLSVRSRAPLAVDEFVLAIPWRSRSRAEGVGRAIGPLLATALDPSLSAEAMDAAIAQAAEQIVAAPAGPPPRLVSPTVPVVSITGTNGKTTTTRMVAHMAMSAGLTTAWSSTDGVFRMGECVDPGDYSGPAGAREVLATPGLDIGILETARGGMLLKGMGVDHNDVSVVTNVSADHLGMQGIDTLDQLAEVKAIVTTITRPGGWAVLNGDDPRVWAMRTGTRARPWVFSLDPDSPAVRDALSAGGRASTVLDGWITVMERGTDPDRLAKIVDVPVTLAGLSDFNTANALAAASAALGLGIARESVVAGLSTFVPSAELNSGRMNCYSLPVPGGTATVVIDLAHNEAGIEALLTVCRGLTVPGGRVHLGLGGTGDRADEAIVAVAEIAGRLADHIVLAHKPHYLRGRTIEEIGDLLRAGLLSSGVGRVEEFLSELEAVQTLAQAAAPGDVIALMCHDQRREVAAWIAEAGGSADGPAQIRRKAIAHRGEHEAEAEIAALARIADHDERILAAATLAQGSVGDPRLEYELARAYVDAGLPEHAEALLVSACDAGLAEPHRHRAQLLLAAGMRRSGRAESALAVLDDLLELDPQSAAAGTLRGQTLADLGRTDEAVAALVAVVLDHTGEEDLVLLGPSLRGPEHPVD